MSSYISPNTLFCLSLFLVVVVLHIILCKCRETKKRPSRSKVQMVTLPQTKQNKKNKSEQQSHDDFQLLLLFISVLQMMWSQVSLTVGMCHAESCSWPRVKPAMCAVWRTGYLTPAHSLMAPSARKWSDFTLSSLWDIRHMPETNPNKIVSYSGAPWVFVFEILISITTSNKKLTLSS